MAKVRWPIEATPLTEELNDSHLFGGYETDSIVVGNKQRSISYNKLRKSFNVDSIAELKTKIGQEDNQLMTVSGYYAGVPLGGKGFNWDSTATAINDINSIKPTALADIDPGRWVYNRATIRMKWAGVRTGVDDTVLAQNAFNLGLNIQWGSGNFILSDKLNLHSYQKVDAFGAVIDWQGDASTNLYEGLSDPNAIEEITIEGGLYTGAPASFLYLEGETANPTSASEYIRNVYLNNIDVSGAKIFLDAQKAVRKVFISGCDVFTENGINGEGKFVEVKIVNSIIYGSTLGAGTYGIRTHLHPDSTASTGFCEGLHVSSCTLDNFDKTLLIESMYVAEFTNCFIAKYSNGSPGILIQKELTTQCKDINFSNNTISGGLVVGAIASGNEYELNIVGNIFIQGQATQIDLKGNTADVVINDNTFSASGVPGSTLGVLIENNVSQISVKNNRFDSTHLRAVSVTGASGVDIVVKDNDTSIVVPVFFERAVINKNNGQVNTTLYAKLTGTGITATNSFTGSIPVTAHVGEKFLLCVSLNLTNTAIGRLAVVLPAGLEAPNGGGWNATFFNIGSATSTTNYFLSIPIFCNTSIVAQSITLKNNDGGDVTLASHSNMSLMKI